MAGTEGQITDEGVARLRARIGIAEPNPQPPHYRCPDTDAFRHVAEAYGDDNPLWCDPSYAARDPVGRPIAPPALVGGDTLIGDDEVARGRARAARPAAAATRCAACTRSTRRAHGSGGRRCARGSRVSRRNALVGVLDKPSEFAGRGRPRVDRPGVPGRRRHPAVGASTGSWSAPSGARRGNAKKYDDASRSTPYTDDGDRRDRRAVRGGSARGAPSRGGGRTSPRATSSARW